MTDLREQLQTSLGSAYRLERELGGGGMSRVFVAHETRLGRKVVVKVLAPDLAAGINADRFEREIKLAASLQQANIVPVLVAGDTNGIPYYTMPFVEGESLRARLARRESLTTAETVRILGDVARALGFAHERGVVHRDIKPDNVLISGGTAVVTDFGIAKALAASRGSDTGTSSALTQLGTSIGTPAYMSPEQAAGDPEVDHRADIYAFGCMAYELLSGHPPFADRASHRVLAAHVNEAPRPVAALRPNTPPALADLVMRCLAKDTSARPQSAAEVLRVLDTVTTGDTIQALPLSALGGRAMLGRALLAYAIALVIVAMLARAAIVAIGLPSWVLPGALIVMALGLPVILLTAYSHHVTKKMLTATPTLTPGGTSVPAAQGTMATIVAKASPHLSWRRTTLGGAYALGIFILLVGGFMLLRALGIGPFGSLLAAGTIERQRPLLMTDFRVVNADSTLSEVIAQAVRSNLEQSSAITVMPRSAAALALQRMERPATARVDLALAQQIAAREGLQAIIDGEIAGIGNGFLLTLRLVTADSARTLASFKQAADNPTQLIAAVDALSRKLRERIGESLRAVQASPGLAEVTTASIEALRKYTAAAKATGAGEYLTAARLAREAIAIDTGFALAYRHLAEAINNAGLPPEEADSAIARAYRMRERLTERERLTVTGEYYAGPGRDRAKAITAYEGLVTLGDYSQTNSLGEQLVSRREFARAESLANIRIRVDPGFSLTYTNRVAWQVDQGRLAAAESSLALSRRLFPARVQNALEASSISYARQNIPGTVGLLDSVQRVSFGRPRSRALGALSGLALLQAKRRDAARLYAERTAVDSSWGAILTPIQDKVFSMDLDAWIAGSSQRHVDRIDSIVSSRLFATARVGERPYLEIAASYARVGSAERARRMIARYEAEVRDTARQRVEQPLLHRALAEIALVERRTGEAITEFRRADSLPDGPATACAECLFADLARAYDSANNADSTIAMIERYMGATNSERLLRDMVYLAPFAKRLGELYESRGDGAKAAAYYQKFVDLWKSADPDLQPRVQEVRQRLQRLRDIEARPR